MNQMAKARGRMHMKYNGINHLALVTPDMDRTIEYWRDLLGLRIVGTFGRQGYRQYFFEVSGTDCIAFFEWEGAEAVREKEHGVPEPGPRAFDHVSLGLEDEDSLWEMKDRIAAAGFWVSEVIDHGFIHSIYTFDPHGVPLELSVNVREADIRERPVAADPSPSRLVKEGFGPRTGRWPEVKEPTPKDERRMYPGMGSEAIQKLKS
jgi:catechol 2,3-dioxygenase-like lactoylglutathione lyase family enzyme